MENRPASANRRRALLRYFAISAAIVLGLAIVIAGYANRRLILKIASVKASVPPKAAQAGQLGSPGSHHVWVSASWALSALPECLRQTYEATGNLRFVIDRMPAGFVHLAPGANLQYADCAIAVKTNEIFVRRGKDRFYVPAKSQLYQRGASILLLYQQGNRANMRIYDPAPAHF